MSDTPQCSEFLEIPTKVANAKAPGRTLESEAERLLRYEAQVIAKREGIPLSEAMGIAKFRAESAERKSRNQQSAKAKAKNLEQERRHDENKRDTTPLYPTNGPPVRGELPGLGKNK